MNDTKSNLPLNIQNLSKHYENLKALDDFSLQIKQGEIFGLLGPNGAGKTTLISILTSLTAPTSGEAFIFGHHIQRDSLAARFKVGLVPQELVSHGFFTVNQILNFHSGYYGLDRNQPRIDFLLEQLALMPHRNKLVSQLSGGMKRRLLIAKALVHNPPLLLLDEPTAGVDVELRSSLWKFVRELNAEGITVLLTTHYLEEAEELCDRVAVIDHGRLIALDETLKLVQQFTQRQVTVKLAQHWEPPNQVEGLVVENDQVRVNIGYDQTVGEMIKRLKIPLEIILDLHVEEGKLEHAFMSLIQGNNQNRTPSTSQ